MVQEMFDQQNSGESQEMVLQEQQQLNEGQVSEGGIEPLE